MTKHEKVSGGAKSPDTDTPFYESEPLEAVRLKHPWRSVFAVVLIVAAGKNSEITN